MSEKDLALSQSSQRRFSRTIGSKVLIQRQTVVTTTSALKVRTKSQSQFQSLGQLKFQQGTKSKKGAAETTRQVNVQSYSKTPKNQSKVVSVSAVKKQQTKSVKFDEDTNDLMALSQQIREALKKVQKFDRKIYPKLSEKELGETLKIQVARLQKNKNSKRQVRSIFYDTELLATALYNHVKLVNELSKQNDQLAAWKKQKEKQLQQSPKRQTQNLKQKLEQQRNKQEQLIQKYLSDKDYTKAKNSIEGFLKKFEKQSALEIAKIQFTLMNHMKILIEEKQKLSKNTLPTQTQKSEQSKQSTKKSQSLAPEKVKLQKQQLKQLEGIGAQLSSKNYLAAKNLIKNYVKKFENESQLASQNQIAVFSYITIIIDELQTLKKQSGSKIQISKLKVQLQKEKIKVTQLEKSNECKRMQQKRQKDVKKQRELIQGALNSRDYISAKNNITPYLKKYQKQDSMNVEIFLLSQIKILIQDSQKQQSLERSRSKSTNKQKLLVQGTVEKEKLRINNQNEKLKVELQNQRNKYQQLLKKSQQNEKSIRQLKSASSDRELAKLKTEKDKLAETLLKQKSKAEQFSKTAQNQRATIIELERKNKQISESKSRPESPGKVTPGTTKIQAVSSEKETYTKDRVKQLNKQIAQLKKEDTKNKREIDRLQKSILKLQAIIGNQEPSLIVSDTAKSTQKEDVSKSLGKTALKNQKQLTKAQIMARQREIQRQKILIEGHLRDRHYYYAKPMLISFLRNFQAVEGYEQLIKHFGYFLGIIDDLELAKRQVAGDKATLPAKNTTKVTKQQKSQEILTIEKQMRQIRMILTEKEQIYTQINTTITRIVQLIQESGEQWWKKLPKRNNKSTDLVTSLYKIIDKFRQLQTDKNKQIAELQHKLSSTTENSQEINTVLTILKTVQGIMSKKEFLGSQRDPWVQIFKGINTRKQVFALLNKVLQSLANQSKNKLALQRKNFEGSVKTYEKQISTLTIKIQQLQGKLKKPQKSPSREKDNKQAENTKLLQQYIQQEKKMLSQLQRSQNQKHTINQKYRDLDLKFKEVNKELLKVNKKVGELESANSKLNSQLNSHSQQIKAMRLTVQKQVKQKYEIQIRNLQGKWNSQRANFQRQIQIKQGLINSKQSQIRLQFESELNTFRREIQEKQNTISAKQKELSSTLHEKQTKLRRQFQKEKDILITRLQQQFRIRETHIRETVVNQFHVKQQNLLKQLQQKQHQYQQSTNRHENYDIQVIQLNTKLIKLQEELNRYVSITESKQTQINALRADMERIIGDEVQKALKSQEQDFSRFLQKNDRQREQYFQNVVIPQKKQQWRIQYNQIVEHVSSISRNVEQINIVQNQIEIVNRQWRQKIVLLQRDFQTRLASVIQEKDKKWTAQIQTILIQKQYQWNNKFISQINEERQRILIERIQMQKNIAATQQREELILLKQIIQNQKIELRQMHVLLERFQSNKTSVTVSEQQSNLRYKQLELQKTRHIYEVKSQYEVRISSLEKDILILQEKLIQAENTIVSYKSMSPAHKESAALMVDLQKKIIFLEASIQPKDNQISYLKKASDNLEVQNKEQRNLINELRFKINSSSSPQGNQKYLDLQYQIRLLKDRQQSLLKNIQANQTANTQLRRSYERKINEINAQKEQEHRQLIKISRQNEGLKAQISHLVQQVRKSRNNHSSFQAIKMKQILKNIQTEKEKEKKVYVYRESDETQMQILKRINGQVGELVQANRHLQMKLLLLEKETQLNSYSPDTINFFLMMQHRIETLVNFLLDNEYIESSETYSKYLQKSNQYLKEIRIEEYFNEFSKLMKQLFHEVYDLNCQQIEEKTKELSILKEQMQDVLQKQIQINQENQYGKNEHYQGYQGFHNASAKTISDIRYLMKEYIRRRDQECLGVVCRSLGLQF